MAHAIRLGCLLVTVRYLFCKDGLYYYRRRVPPDIAPHYQGRRLLMVSLGTRNEAEAIRKVVARTAEDDALWRSLMSPEGKAADLTTRESESAARALLRSLALEPGEVSTHPLGAEPLLDHFQSAHGDDWYEARGDDVARTAMLTPVEREAWRLYTGGARLNLSDALSLYLSHHVSRGPKFAADNKRATDRLIKLVGDLPVDKLKRDHANGFRDLLLSEDLKTRTVDREIGRVCAIINYAKREKGLELTNHFEGVIIPDLGRDGTKYPSFTDAELRIIASSCCKEDDEVRYIIAAQVDTGARLGEMVGLRLEDVHLEGDTPYIRIDTFEDGRVRRVKTEASKRNIPLVGMSLWAIGRAVGSRRGKRGWVFPRYASDTLVRATSASNTINKWIRGLPGVEQNRSSHCFRATMADRLRRVETPKEIRELICGWGTGPVAEVVGIGLA